MPDRPGTSDDEEGFRRMIDDVVTALPSTALTTESTTEPPRTSPYTVEVALPAYLHEEVSQVAESENCEISEIVLNALDQFLADHWVRSAKY